MLECFSIVERKFDCVANFTCVMSADTKDQWARDDPAFLVLLTFWLFGNVTSITFFVSLDTCVIIIFMLYLDMNCALPVLVTGAKISQLFANHKAVKDITFDRMECTPKVQYFICTFPQNEKWHHMWIIGTEALVNDLPVLAAGTHESSHTLLYHLDYYRCCFLSYNNNNNNNRFTVLCPGLPGCAGTRRNTHPPTIIVFFQQHMPIPSQPVLLQYQYYIIYSQSFSQLLTQNSVFYLNITCPSDHSHLCSLKCHLIFFSDRPGLTSVQHILHTQLLYSLSLLINDISLLVSNRIYHFAILPCHILGNLVIKMIKAFCFPACTSI